MAKYLNKEGLSHLVNKLLDREVQNKGLSTNDFTDKHKNLVESLIDGTGVLDLLTYGVEWKPNVADPVLTRVGNMNYHKTLPIQSGMKGCIYNPIEKKVVYWLDEEDWRFRSKNVEGIIYYDTGGYGDRDNGDGTYTLHFDCYGEDITFADYVEVNGIKCKFIELVYNDWQTGALYSACIKVQPLDSDDTLPTSGKIKIRDGARLDGYDGEVMVYVPEFWIKSWDEPDRKCVRVSPTKIDESWEHQPAVYISAYRNTIIAMDNSMFLDMNYLYNLVDTTTYGTTALAVSICNNASYCRGGNNDSTNDNDEDVFKRQLGKPRTNIDRQNFRWYSQAARKEIMSYRQYKNIMYWLYVIEYANFNSQAPFNPELTTEGFHQGGLGKGITEVNNWTVYNNAYPICPCGYTNDIGNGTGVKLIAPLGPAPVGSVYATRWRGLENPFGDVNHCVDGIIVNGLSINEDGVKYSEVYTTDNPDIYGDYDYNEMEKVGEEYSNSDGFTKEYTLNSTAEIIAQIHGGTSTTYKCDQHVVADSTGPKLVLLGGAADSFSAAGLGCTYTRLGYSGKTSRIGYRTSCLKE